KMKEMETGLEIPAGDAVQLQPGGYHVMFMNITDTPTEGSTIPVTLTFERAGDVTLDLPVAAIGAPSLGAAGADGGGHGHGAMSTDAAASE
ncbi:MAG: copper chaperone PCu(A)C, partial [Pseudomonadota bacterium]